jgi:hypothetical protein
VFSLNNGNTLTLSLATEIASIGVSLKTLCLAWVWFHHKLGKICRGHVGKIFELRVAQPEE